jgi:dipeptidyl aminopeptidase/acylaminoacyl peptidase
MTRHIVLRSIPAVVAIALLAASGSARAQQAITLETLLSAAFPSEIVAAPSGGRVAWVQNVKGSRNVWVASAPNFSPRQVTSYTGDDGQDITSLTWMRDGRTVLYVRGGGPNRQGEVPNPAMSPQSAEQAIWAVDVTESGVPRKLATGSSPAVSSTGQVAYLSRGQVWATNVAGSEKPAQLFTIRGSAGSLRWSPDGAKLAFVSGRVDHAFIGVYDVAAKSLRYLEPSIDLDAKRPCPGPFAWWMWAAARAQKFGKPNGAPAACSRASRRRSNWSGPQVI